MGKNRPTTDIASVAKVRQVIEVDSLAAANEFLKGGGWILLNSYQNRRVSDTPLMRLGRIREE